MTETRSIPNGLLNRLATTAQLPPDPVKDLAGRLHQALFEVFMALGYRNPRIFTGDLTLAQLSILMTLRETGPIRMTALAAHERVRNPTATVAIHRLEKLALVARSPDPKDSRGVLVRITQRGIEVCCDSLAIRRAQFATLLTRLSAEDHATLNEAIPPLQRLVDETAVSPSDSWDRTPVSINLLREKRADSDVTIVDHP